MRDAGLPLLRDSIGTSVALRGGSGCPGRRSSRALPRVFAPAMATRRYAFASAVIGAARGVD